VTSLGRGATLGVLTVVAERGLSFAALLLVARVLEPDRFGLYVYLLAGLMPIQVMSDQGIEVAATHFMARRGRRAASALAIVMLGRLAVWLVVGLPMALFLLPSMAGCPVGTAFVASLCMLVGPSLPYRTLHRARGDMVAVGRIAVADGACMLVATGGVLAAGGGVAAVFATRALVGFGVTAWAAGWSRTWPMLDQKTGRVASKLFDAAWPLAVNAALLTLMVRTGHLIAMRLLGSESVGMLGAAARVAEMLSMLAEGVMLAAFPAMAAAPRKAPKVADDVAGALGLLVGWAVAVTTAGAVPIVRLLYGTDYGDAAGALGILSWGALVSAAGSVAFYRLVVSDRQRLLLQTNAIAVVVGLGLQLPLVWLAGVRGAAGATVLTLGVGQALLCWDRDARQAVGAAWARVLPAALVALGAVAAARVCGAGWEGFAVALIAYPLAAMLAGVVRESDREALRALARVVRDRVAARRSAG